MLGKNIKINKKENTIKNTSNSNGSISGLNNNNKFINNNIINYNAKNKSKKHKENISSSNSDQSDKH